MNKILIAALVAVGIMGCSDKADAAETYVQGGAGLTKYDFSGASKDQQGISYFGSVGYIFDNNLGVEGEYQYTDTADLASGAKVESTDYYTVYGVGRIPLDNQDKVNFLAKAGVGYSDTEVKIGGSNNSDTAWYPAFAAGVEWMLTENVGAVGLVDYKSYDYSTGGNDFKADPITYKVGLQYRF